ncbi:hypothetical protein DFH06DRAFT_1314407 [Mycena polygramma]|nr:hypothetical protein DFH06DRAFT_1314407 [Mycena polygramma]
MIIESACLGAKTILDARPSDSSTFRHLEVDREERDQQRRLPYTFYCQRQSTSSLALSEANLFSTCKTLSRALAGNPRQGHYLDSDPNGCRVSASAYCAPLELLLVIIFDFISRVSRPETFDQARGRPARPPRQTSRAEDCLSSTKFDLGRYRLSASAICIPLELLPGIIFDFISRVLRPETFDQARRPPARPSRQTSRVKIAPAPSTYPGGGLGVL